MIAGTGTSIKHGAMMNVMEKEYMLEDFLAVE